MSDYHNHIELDDLVGRLDDVDSAIEELAGIIAELASRLGHLDLKDRAHTL